MSTPVASPIRQDWLDRWQEEILEPDLPIIDPHHHLWDRPGWRYLLDELLVDLNSGHNIVATVFLQCRAMHRADGPEPLRPVGETEFVNGVAAMSASGGYGRTRVCAGIVGHADLTLGASVRDVLEAHIHAGGGRFRGIRHSNAWDARPTRRDRGCSPSRTSARASRNWRRSASPSMPGSITRRSPN
jgi:L-fuconolactonase